MNNGAKQQALRSPLVTQVQCLKGIPSLLIILLINFSNLSPVWHCRGRRPDGAKNVARNVTVAIRLVLMSRYSEVQAINEAEIVERVRKRGPHACWIMKTCSDSRRKKTGNYQSKM